MDDEAATRTAIGTGLGDGTARRLAVAGLVLAVGVVVILTSIMSADPARVEPFDQAVTRVPGMGRWAGRPVTAALVIGRLTAPMHSFLIAGLAVVILARARLRAAAAFLALSASAGVALTEVLKVSIGRSRPPGAEQYETDLAKSYPSGHSSAGIYLYLAAGTVLVQLGRATGAAWMSRMGWALIAFGPAIGVTRLVLGVHWPTDVVAGWALGSTAALTAALLLWTAISRGWPMVGAAPRAALGAGPGTAAESAPGTAAAGASSEPGHSGASSEPGHSGASSEPGHSGAGGEPGSEPGRGGGAGMGGPGTG